MFAFPTYENQNFLVDTTSHIPPGSAVADDGNSHVDESDSHAKSEPTSVTTLRLVCSRYLTH
jgi:hypothetical protein